MVFKCKMCGGDIEPIKNTNTGKCIYCKSVMTLPDLDNEKIVNLYNRANSLRLDNEFDKSKEIYEKILELDNKQMEAHWGILLCKYGVEYIDDPKTKKKIPTCHRTNDSSILSDADYKMIKKESYGDALKLYEDEATRIDEIQKGILKISNQEKPYDVFICYKETDQNGERTKDSVIAQDIYDKLIESGLKVFFARITLEDKLGREYEPYIYSALKTSKVMLVVGTKEENFGAVWVKNEWSRFLEMMKQDKGKVLIPVYSKIDAYKLPEEFSMLQAQSMDKVGAIQDLTRGIKKVIDEYKNPELKDIDEETVAKVQKALEEAKSIGNGQYEVNIVKEKLPVWYYVLCILAAIFYPMFKIVTLSFGCTSLNSLEFMSYKEVPFLLIVELIYIIIIFIYFVGLFINRKTYKLSKKIFPILLILFAFKFVLSLNNLIIAGDYRYHGFVQLIIFYGCDIIAILISHFVTPTWNLDTSSKSIMNLNEKNIQIEKNDYIRKNFKKKEKNKNNRLSKKIVIILIIILMIFSVITILKIWNVLPYKQRNLIDNTTNQKQTLGRKKLYSAPNKDSNILLVVRAYDYYNILNFNEIKVNDDLRPYGFVKVKTNKNIIGYLYLGEKNDYSENVDYKIICGKDNEECLNKFSYSNKRDESVKQIRITNETLNLRKNHSVNEQSLAVVKQGDIFNVLDTYVEEITEQRKHKDYDNIYSPHFLEYVTIVVEKRNWYKIKTSNDLEGWICENVGNEKYVELLEQK